VLRAVAAPEILLLSAFVRAAVSWEGTAALLFWWSRTIPRVESDPSPHPVEDLPNRAPPSDRAGFLYRLGIYCIGIAIGFMILGMFRARSAAEARRREADRAAYEAQFAQPQAPVPVPAPMAPAQPDASTGPTRQLDSPR